MQHLKIIKPGRSAGAMGRLSGDHRLLIFAPGTLVLLLKRVEVVGAKMDPFT